MRLNYKRLGNYIELVNCLNSKLQYGETDVRGVSNNKEIIQTRANNEGRDFNTFYVVEPGGFIYNSRTSRMGDKVGLGYNDTNRTFITSFNNTVFRVKDEALLPMYLFMWFNRPEFDRYVRFNSWGSSTEIFSWEEMCNTLLPIPSLAKQKEIVSEYKVIQNRIALNQQLIQKLEETAQAIYREWFVEGIDLENLPDGWRVGIIDNISELINRGITPSYNDREGITILNQKCIRNNSVDLEFSRKHNERVKKIPIEKLLKQYDILVNSTGDGTLGRVAIVKEIVATLTVDSHITILRTNSQNNHLYVWGNIRGRSEEIANLAEGSTGQTELSRSLLSELPILIPDKITQDKFAIILEKEVRHSYLLEQENQKLTELKDLLLSKLASIEN